MVSTYGRQVTVDNTRVLSRHRTSLCLESVSVSFDLRQLRYFVTVAEEGSLTRAAARIPVAQQSLSEQIRALERQVGAPLLIRGPRGVRLTDVGAALLGEARPLLTRTDRAFDRMRRLAVGERQTLHVGFLPSVGN